MASRPRLNLRHIMNIPSQRAAIAPPIAPARDPVETGAAATALLLEADAALPVIEAEAARVLEMLVEIVLNET